MPGLSPIAIARPRCAGEWIPIAARHSFIVHCSSGAAAPISDSMRSSKLPRSGPYGLFITRPAVSLHLARAALVSSEAIYPSSWWVLVFDARARMSPCLTPDGWATAP